MKQKGFTRVELIIVIAIIAVLAGAIFVAVDPARRLHETRNARRANDIATILDAIKLYQVDAEGEHYSAIEAMTPDDHYMIGTNANGCIRTCAGATTEDACVDLSGIGSSYLATVPVDPLDGEPENTGYKIQKDANGAITITACDAEAEGQGGGGDTPSISITR